MLGKVLHRTAARQDWLVQRIQTERCTGEAASTSVDTPGCAGTCCVGGACRTLSGEYQVTRLPDGAVDLDGDPREFEVLPRIALPSRYSSSRALIWVAWDAEAFYVAFKVFDNQLVAYSAQRDAPLWEEDSVEIIVDTEGDGGQGQMPGLDDYKFVLSARGTQADVRGPWFVLEWNATWTSAVRVHGVLDDESDIDRGYTGELRVPWMNWGVRAPGAGRAWRAEVILNDRARRANPVAVSPWQNTLGGSPNVPDGFGTFRF